MPSRSLIERAYLIPGWAWPRELHQLAVIAETEQPALHVEVGVFAGRSLFAFAMHCKNANCLAVDNFSAPTLHTPGRRWVEACLRATVFEIEKAADDVAVDVRLESSLDAARYVAEGDTRPATVYIDGDHTLPAVKADIEIWLELLLPGGLLFGHDYWPNAPGVMDAVNALLDGFDVLPNSRIWTYRKK